MHVSRKYFGTEIHLMAFPNVRRPPQVVKRQQDHCGMNGTLANASAFVRVLEAGNYEVTNQHVRQNGKLEDNPATGSPPRTTLLGTIFSPVFNFFSPANKNGKYCTKI